MLASLLLLLLFFFFFMEQPYGILELFFVSYWKCKIHFQNRPIVTVLPFKLFICSFFFLLLLNKIVLFSNLKIQYCPLCIARLRSLAAIFLVLKYRKISVVFEIRLHRICYCYSIALRY